MSACSTAAHEPHEVHVAAEVIAGERQGNKEQAASAFNARVIPSVAYPDPEVAWLGLTEDPAKARTHLTACG
jgi:dihydrolipoamide dehydrogenase